MKWLPHDLGTWSFVISVAALILALPLGIVGTLLAPRVQVWWAVRSVTGTANEIRSLMDYRKRVEKEPLFSVTETLLYEQQLLLLQAIHLLAYVVILAVALIPKVHPPMGIREMWLDTLPALPFVFLLIFSATYFGIRTLSILQRSSPKERQKIENRIDQLVGELRKKQPPS